MDQEKSSAEITNVFPKTPEMFVIKGRQRNYVSSPMPPLYVELKRFAIIKDGTMFHIQLPLESLSKRIIKRSGDIFLSAIVIAGILSWLIPLMALLNSLL